MRRASLQQSHLGSLLFLVPYLPSQLSLRLGWDGRGTGKGMMDRWKQKESKREPIAGALLYFPRQWALDLTFLFLHIVIQVLDMLGMNEANERL